MAPPESGLFQPLQVGTSKLAHRIAMAPLTRFRADFSHAPTPMMATQYAQRACIPGTLLIAEATFISPTAGGYDNVPGIWSSEQIAGWKSVTEAVHANGSFIYLQLWALGRTAKKSIAIREGWTVQAPSPIPMEVDPRFARKDATTGKVIDPDVGVPQEMTSEDIQQKVREYAIAARNAVLEAGFDGVEVHGANGYLVDQFLQDVTNNRADEYGGSAENRARFALEVVEAVIREVGAERVGIRLSPWSVFQGMRMHPAEKAREQFGYLVRELKTLGVGYIHLVRAVISGGMEVSQTGLEEESLDFAVHEWGKDKPVIIAGGLTPETARKMVEEEYPGYQIVAAFGRRFIANPDLVFRIREGIELEEYDRATFYITTSEVGYLDQKFSREFEERYGVQGGGTGSELRN